MPATSSILATHPFLKGLPTVQIAMLLPNSMEVEFAAGKFIFREGELANRFYLVLEGEVALESPNRETGKAPQLIQTIGAGDVLGWSWLFPPYYWRFDARAVQPTKAIFIYGTRVRELCEQDHALGHELMRRTAAVLIERLQATRRHLLEQTRNPFLAPC